MKIAPMAGIAYANDVLTGQKPFPTYKGKKQNKEDFKKDYLDKEMERRKK